MHYSVYLFSPVLRLGIAIGSLTGILFGQTALHLVDNPSIPTPDPALLAPCRVSGLKPVLELDLKYHTGYVVHLPLKVLAGDGGVIDVVMRVTPLENPGRGAWLTGRIDVPPIEPDNQGSVEISGEYVVGPGHYRVDWLLKSDKTACSAHWDIEAAADRNFADLPLGVPPASVGVPAGDPFQEVRRLISIPSRQLSVKVLVNYSPVGSDHSVMTGSDVEAITSILKAVAREPRFGHFQIVAFSMDQQQVLYRQPEAPAIDFPALGQAIENLRTGTVDIRRLKDRESGARFLTKLLGEELRAEDRTPDAVIVISPNFDLDRRPAVETISQEIGLKCPVYYLNYNPDPIADPWRGALGNIVKNAFRGVEYTVTRPADLVAALGKMRTSFADRASNE